MNFFRKKNDNAGAGGNPVSPSGNDAVAKKPASSWSPSMVLETNLIQGDTSVNYDWKKHIKSLAINIFLAALLVAFAYGGLLFWSRSTDQNGDIKASIRSLEVKAAELEKNVNEIDNFEKKLKIAGVLLDGHIYWDGFFEFLEKNLLDDVYLPENFSGTPDGHYSFSARTTSYGVMIDQILYLRQNPSVKEVKLSGANYDFGRDKSTTTPEILQSMTWRYPVSFTIDLELDPNIFYKK